MEVKTPEGTAFTLRVPLNRDKTNFATFFLKEMSEDVYMATKELIDRRKTFDGVRLAIKTLSLEGSDPVDHLKTNFIALNSACQMILEIIEPVTGELKKN